MLKKFDNWDELESNLAKRVPCLLVNPSSYFTTGEAVNKHSLKDVLDFLQSLKK